MERLTAAYEQLEVARANGVPERSIAQTRAQVVGGLNELYDVVPVASRTLFAFDPVSPPVDIADVVLGPDGAPYVLDAGTQSVYRINVGDSTASAIMRAGKAIGDTTPGEPRFLAVGGPDVVIVDSDNNVWRWRPADNEGVGTLARVRIADASGWGDDIIAVGTWLRDTDLGRYNLYVVDPSEEQILAYAPARDGSGFPGDPTGRLATKRPVDDITCLYIDGDIFLAEDGAVERLVNGRTDGWEAAPPGDTLLRPEPAFERVFSGSGRREGAIYGYDPENGRILAFDKAAGDFVEQYVLAREPAAWEDLRGMYVVPGAEGAPATLVWATEDAVHQSLLEAVRPATGASPSPRTSPSGSAAPSGGSPAASESGEADGAP
jgi:hypothetical protein